MHGARIGQDVHSERKSVTFFNSPRFCGAALAFALVTLPVASSAQEAVPLSPELFDLHWVAIDYEGWTEGVDLAPATLLVSDAEFGHVGGQTGCGTDWTAKVEIDLPRIVFTEVEAFYEDSCPAYRNTIALLEALENVTQAATTPEGLELRDENDRRLLLLVSGG